MEFDTSTREPPQQMVWCGNDCVILHWSGLGVLMVGPGGDWNKYVLLIVLH
jgi:vacuolar protein sorting-associated protein 16